MKEAVLLLGSNLGPRYKKLEDACDLIGKHAGKITKHSSVYESEPWGFQDENKFLNQVVFIETSLEPGALLRTLQDLEDKLGKKRTSQEESYSSRTIDIDILFYHNEIIETGELSIPHKLLHRRKFTLLPLSEIAGNLIHPVFNKTILQLLAECPDDSKVYKTKTCFHQ
ncbi:MAG: 2-amino-4-hydroxy-6-hydroxymethyldihydropteridine diphosphokinase [Bacteroidales bacterium]|nr:2-amino-4-hydroxy-6-hydroxymethyldihydropteridine diphosphokinase [Bacteroidales bacterium]